MSVKQNITWIDLTMLAHWEGQLTGIQRVEYNLAKRFAKKPYVKFCVFDKTRRFFFKYDFSHIEAKIAALQTTSQPAPEVESSFMARYASALRRVVARRLPVVIKHPLKAIYRRMEPRSSNGNQPTAVVFNEGDKLLILSGDWSNEIFASTVTAMKKERAFKLVQIVYDLLPVVQPAFFVPGMPDQVSYYMRAIFDICDGILAISEATKKDIQFLQKHWQIRACPVKIFRLGEDFVNEEPLKPHLPIGPKKFLLCVGTVEARKNHQSLYYMIREAIKRNIELPPIVIAGKHGWLVDNFVYLVKNDPQISQKVLFLHNGTDRELAWLFQNCLFTLYPSFYEGWGLPIAESLFYDKLCLASSTSSMPEIAGDLIDYFSPNDPSEMLGLVVKYIDRPKQLEGKEKAIKTKYQPTSWEATFRQVEAHLMGL